MGSGRPRFRSAGRVIRVAAAVASALVVAVAGIAWSQYRDLDAGIRRSGSLDGLAAPSGTAQNLLIMGLDSRLDENGNPLPPALYQALDTGGPDVGGYNANVLMLLHIPGDGARATAISVPRDDYVDLPGSPDGVAKGKIKQAYGLAFDQEHRALVAQGLTDKDMLEQRSRDAGRDAEIVTVGEFLGGMPIDHFVEVTMVAFYQVAQVVQPITVCVDENTRDSYSGADFHQGYQQIDAAQAVAFVRQRRDTTHPQLDFTDLDRERRQQAFIASLAYQLKQTGTLADPSRLTGLIDVAEQNIAVDPGLNLLTLASQATSLTSGNIRFTTLPIERFGKDPRGEDINIVDLPTIQATVAALLDPAATGTPATTAATAPPPTVDVVNGSGRSGLAAAVSHRLASDGFAVGPPQTTAVRAASVIDYPPGAAQAAIDLARMTGVADTVADSRVPTGHLSLVLGTRFRMPATAAASSAPPPAGSDRDADLTPIAGGGIPCVK